MKKLQITLMVVCLLALPGAARALGFEVAVGGWAQSPAGDIGYEVSGSQDRLDLDKDAGLDGETRAMGRAKIELPLILPNVYLMATPIEFSGKGSKSVPFNFGGETFLAGVKFDSELRMNQYDIALYYGVPFVGLASLGKLNIDLGLNMRIMELYAEVSQGSDSESLKESLMVPLVYVGVQLNPTDRFGLEVEGRGIAYDSNHYLDLIARLRVKVFGPAFAAGGWRHQDIKIDVSDVEGKFTVSGPFLEAGLKF